MIVHTTGMNHLKIELIHTTFTDLKAAQACHYLYKLLCKPWHTWVEIKNYSIWLCKL